jgi:hypothetical protein
MHEQKGNEVFVVVMPQCISHKWTRKKYIEKRWILDVANKSICVTYRRNFE